MTTSSANPKIIDLINAHKDGEAPCTSIEFFPPRTEDGVKVRSQKQHFYDVYFASTKWCN